MTYEFFKSPAQVEKFNMSKPPEQNSTDRRDIFLEQAKKAASLKSKALRHHLG